MHFPWNLAFVVLALASRSLQAEVPLDSSFAGDGRQAVAFDVGASKADIGQKIFTAPGGGYFVAGFAQTTAYNGREFALAQLGADGAVVTSSHVETLFSSIQAIAMDSQSRFVVVGTLPANPGPGSDLLVMRFLPNGQIDGSFGFFGLTSFDLEAYDEPLAVATTPGDHIVLVFRTSNDGANWINGYVMAYDQSGALRSTNQPVGLPIETAALAWSAARGRMLAAIGRDDCTLRVDSVAVTVTTSVSLSRSMLLVQDLPDAPLACSADVSATAVMPDAAGQGFMVAGYVRDVNLAEGGNRMGWVVRVGANNLFDAGFAGNGGRIDLPPFPWDDLRYFSLARDGEGRLLAGGQFGHSSGSAQLFAVRRYSAAGVPDTSFGPAGESFVSTTFSGLGGTNALSYGRDVLVDGERVLLAGSRLWSSGDFDFAIAAWKSPSPLLFDDGFE